MMTTMTTFLQNDIFNVWFSFFSVDKIVDVVRSYNEIYHLGITDKILEESLKVIEMAQWSLFFSDWLFRKSNKPWRLATARAILEYLCSVLSCLVKNVFYKFLNAIKFKKRLIGEENTNKEVSQGRFSALFLILSFFSFFFSIFFFFFLNRVARMVFTQTSRRC